MIIDVLFLVAAAYYGYKGYTKGLLYSLIVSLASVFGIVAAITFSSMVNKLLFDENSDNIFMMKFIPILSYLIVFFATRMLVRLGGNVLKRSARTLGLGVVDRLLGAALALLTLSAIVSLALWALGQLGILSEAASSSSIVYATLEPLSTDIIDFIQWIFPFIKASFLEMQMYFEELQQSIVAYVAVGR